MSSIISMLEQVALLAILIAVAYSVKNYLSYMKYKKSKAEIMNLQSKVITLRTVLKLRVKSKINSFKGRMDEIVQFDTALNHPLNELLTLQFHGGREVQRYFEMATQINELVISTLKTMNKIPENFADYSNLSKADQIRFTILDQTSWLDNKTELGIMRVIKELYNVNTNLNYNIDQFNEAYGHRKKFKPFKKDWDYNFPMLNRVKEVFMESEELLQQKTAADVLQSSAA